MIRALVMVILIGLAGSCTWVKVSEAGSAVGVTTVDQTADCESLGRITAISRASVAGIDRSETKLAGELATIARNEAGSMGGDTVAPLAPRQGNEQKFGVYRCANPQAAPL